MKIKLSIIYMNFMSLVLIHCCVILLYYQQIKYQYDFKNYYISLQSYHTLF